jgi:hypothetical protein
MAARDLRPLPGLIEAQGGATAERWMTSSLGIHRRVQAASDHWGPSSPNRISTVVRTSGARRVGARRGHRPDVDDLAGSASRRSGTGQVLPPRSEADGGREGSSAQGELSQPRPRRRPIARLLTSYPPAARSAPGREDAEARGLQCTSCSHDHRGHSFRTLSHGGRRAGACAAPAARSSSGGQHIVASHPNRILTVSRTGGGCCARRTAQYRV